MSISDSLLNKTCIVEFTTTCGHESMVYKWSVVEDVELPMVKLRSCRLGCSMWISVGELRSIQEKDDFNKFVQSIGEKT